MKALYDLDQTVIRMVPKWIKLCTGHKGAAAKILKKFPNYEDIKDDIDKYIDDYNMPRYFGFNQKEKDAMYSLFENCRNFYQEFADMELPDFGIKGIEEITIISQCEGDSPVALSKRELLDAWKEQGKIADWQFCGEDKAGFIAQSKYKGYDFLAEDHTETPMKIIELLPDMKIHMVEYPYNRHIVVYLKNAYPLRTI